ncbi:Sir2 silent information regulator family NAD-dependent deacetylase [Metabacillus litoralis]|uniref:Sir2 silent information regulator family NAD-dependent deacetylase n=1 Tax=Metabacillus litoralis TaxID=152268 RepID=UPI002040536D|nr:Sir2 silent information regulator family NAD-dependent deacetylase [Metabacillus litoralis]MCM3651379.1 Sir2 silent information regulator family NAD-dependent deacetylase [Metabacillus litoralis]
MNETYQTRVDKAKQAIEGADFILLGGGAGLSAAAGIVYSGKRFTENFAPFIEKYGLTDMYLSGFYPFRTQEERWSYWAKHISLNRYEAGATKLYMDLFNLVKDKKYFVISTNVESQFVKAGFPSEKVFEIQGNYGYHQCAKGCHDKLYDNELLVKEMVEKTVDCKIPSELVPKCPVCGGEMDPNLRINHYFVQDERWYELNKSYNDFLQDSEGKKIIYIELGVGFNTPGIIRYPFEKMTYYNKNARLIRLNKDHPEGLEENIDKTIAFTEEMQAVVSAIMN